jgi:hypothetical protein
MFKITKWRDITPEELYMFFAVTMLMIRVKKLTVLDYCSADSLISTSQFSDFMSRNRYLLLLRLLHFSDNNNQPKGDQLYKIKPIIDHLKKQ